MNHLALVVEVLQDEDAIVAFKILKDDDHFSWV